jgi:hypothetical protein
VVTRVFALNILLAALAVFCIHFNTPITEIAALVAGCAATTLLLWRFSRQRQCAS